ncbi:MAG: thioredoxin domain-containing protein [Patescibacteria group bacterium]
MNNENSNNEKNTSLLSALGPKRSFIFGIIAAFLVISSLGFYVLLLTDNDTGSNTKVLSGTTGAVNTNTDVLDPPTGNIEIQPVTSDDHVRGNLNIAEVVIVEFSDPECPFCQRFHATMQETVAAYGDQVAWVYRHFPLDSLHSKARKEAEATECAAELGGNEAFWAYTDRLYEITPSNNGLAASQLPEIASDVGLDTAKFQDCLDSGKYADKVAAQLQDATASGGNGTPYSVAISKNGETVPISGAQPVASLKNIIDGLL